MFWQNLISFPYNKIFIIGFLFCSFVSFDTFGQEEREIVISEPNEGYGALIGSEGSDHFGPEGRSTEIKATNVPAPREKENKKEQPYQYEEEREVNKEEMSTLSFNLFLYVVDKFKEDN